MKGPSGAIKIIKKTWCFTFQVNFTKILNFLNVDNDRPWPLWPQYGLSKKLIKHWSYCIFRSMHQASLDTDGGLRPNNSILNGFLPVDFWFDITDRQHVFWRIRCLKRWCSTNSFWILLMRPNVSSCWGVCGWRVLKRIVADIYKVRSVIRQRGRFGRAQRSYLTPPPGIWKSNWFCESFDFAQKASWTQMYNWL